MPEQTELQNKLEQNINNLDKIIVSMNEKLAMLTAGFAIIVSFGIGYLLGPKKTNPESTNDAATLLANSQLLSTLETSMLTNLENADIPANTELQTK
jgi:hypothetical protein